MLVFSLVLYLAKHVNKTLRLATTFSINIPKREEGEERSNRISIFVTIKKNWILMLKSLIKPKCQIYKISTVYLNRKRFGLSSLLFAFYDLLKKS